MSIRLATSSLTARRQLSTSILTRDGTTPLERPIIKPAFVAVHSPIRVIFQIGEDRAITIPLNIVQQLLIGRADLAEGFVPGLDLTSYEGEDRGVSRRHAMLHLVEGDLFLRDLGSTNGTRVNGTRIMPEEMIELHDGDEIAFGGLRTSIRFLANRN